MGAVADAVELPAEHADHLVADGELRVLRGHHLARRAADHDVAEVHRRGVGLGVVHAAAHVGVEREEMVAHQHLAVGDLRHGGLDQLEIRLFDPAGRPAGQKDLLVGIAHIVTFSSFPRKRESMGPRFRGDDSQSAVSP
jgi:hypothetical protein